MDNNENGKWSLSIHNSIRNIDDEQNGRCNDGKGAINDGVTRQRTQQQPQRLKQGPKHFLSSWNVVVNLLLRPGLLFCCIFIWLSITGGRFLAPFLEQQVNMTPKMIGICLAIQSAVVTVGGSISGPWADQREQQFPGRGRMEIIALGIVIGTICCLLHNLPHILVRWSYSVSRDNETSMGQIGSSTWVTMYHFVLRIGYGCSVCCTLPILDAVTLQYLERHPRKSRDDYGRERLFGAIGWAITNSFYGILIDRFGFQVTFPLALLVMAVALVAISLYTRQQIQLYKRLAKRQSDIIDDNNTDNMSPSDESTGTEAATEETTEAATDLSDQQQDGQAEGNTSTSRVFPILRSFFGTWYSTGFMLCLFLLSSGQVVVDVLLFLFFETLESSYSMMGITVFFTVAFEVPIFQVAPTLLEHTNAGILLLVGCISYIVRVLGYASIPKGHIAYVLALEPLHGVTYACAQMSAVDTASKFSPPGWEATGQGLISLVRGSGSFFGLLYGGWAVQHLGGRYMYEISSCVVSLGVICFGTAYCLQTPLHASSSSLRRGEGSQYIGLQQEGDEEDMKDDDDDIDSNLDRMFPIANNNEGLQSELELQPMGQLHSSISSK